MKRPALGFTLIELMIVVAIIALLAMIAFPSYENFVRRANRVEAQSLLLRIASEQEKFFSTFNRYSADIDGARTGDPATSGLNMAASTQDLVGGSPDPNDQAYYTIAVAVGNPPTSYVLTATPVGSMQSVDSCGNMTLDDRGNKGAAAVRCW
ncbi:MAG: type IV pilin protein [Burkholderiaceae bacterium]|nr:type IV pilin protein [Burkholderiaceae bacterium]